MASFWQNLSKPILVLAPMEDVTDVVFREVIAQAARPDVFFTEFTSSDGLTSKGKDKVIRKLKFNKTQHPIVAQIWGNNIENLYESAKIVKKLGFDGIDINMGCPDRSIVKRGECGGLIGNESLVKQIVAAVRKGATGLPLSVKTRFAPDAQKTEKWISFLLEQKIEALTIHGRTVKQMSKGEANWQEIGEAVMLRDNISPQTIIIGNGDILSYQQALFMHDQYRIDGVMIGRGIFSNPWVFKKSLELETHPKEDYIEVLTNHLKLFDETWGDTKNFDIMKKFFKMYVKDFAGANQLRQSLMETKSRVQVEQILSKTL